MSSRFRRKMKELGSGFLWFGNRWEKPEVGMLIEVDMDKKEFMYTEWSGFNEACELRGYNPEHLVGRRDRRAWGIE